MGGSSVTRHTVPPLYACYLLRSHAKPNMTYVGSTPDPVRRLKQHNGLAKQGAMMTRFARPWSMDVLVYGFPSRLAALQFEWSWQSPHVSRHLRDATAPGTRATHAGRSAASLFPADRQRAYTSRSGQQRVKQRVSGVPEQRLLVMRALLASEPFCFWNLQVAFCTEWAYGLWLYWERSAPRPVYDVGRVTHRPLPRPYPRVVCDFAGVLGTASPLAAAGSETEAWPPLPEAATCSAWQKQQQAARTARTARKARRSPSPEPQRWPEHMPLARDAQTLGLTWDDLRAAPRLLPERSPRKARSALHAEDDACVAFAAAQIARATDTPLPDARAAYLAATHRCGLCHTAVDKRAAHTYVACPSQTAACTAHFHLVCLARHCTPSHGTARTFCLPVEAHCPACQGPAAPWPKVVRRVFRGAELLSL